MDFHLAFTPRPLPQQINHRQPILLMGSCFTENIGDKLITNRFTVLQNPNGILFNPVSVREALMNYVQGTAITDADLFYLNEAWHSWQHHSRFSGVTATDAVERINASTAAAHHFLKSCQWIIITLGSAWVYELTEKAPLYAGGKVAANNHKAPADWFQRRLLSNEEAEQELRTAVTVINQFNPFCNIIFTISPVRHLREGFVENNRSKAALINAVHAVAESQPQVFYFPAYELVIDDLRDYRFYAEDMVHPNYAATNYVWEKFIGACIDPGAQQIMKSIQELNMAMQHKPFNPSSAAHQNFRLKYLEMATAMQRKYPFLDLDDMIRYFS